MRRDIAHKIHTRAENALDETEVWLLVLVHDAAIEYGKQGYKGVKEHVENAIEKIAQLFDNTIRKQEDPQKVMLTVIPMFVEIIDLFPQKFDYKPIIKILQHIISLATKYKSVSIVADQIEQGVDLLDFLETRIEALEITAYGLSSEIYLFRKKFPSVLTPKHFAPMDRFNKLIEQIKQLNK